MLIPLAIDLWLQSPISAIAELLFKLFNK